MSNSELQQSGHSIRKRVHDTFDYLNRAGIGGWRPEISEADRDVDNSQSEEHDPVSERDARAREIANAAQETIGEAYRSPFTLNAAYEAARMALEQMTTERGEQ